MRIPLKLLLAFVAGAAFAVTSAPIVAADAYPSKQIRLLVGFEPPGAAALNALIVGPQLAKEMGTTIVVENIAGARGNFAAVEAKRAAPDGYTFFYATLATVLAPSLYANPGFDPFHDFTPVSRVAINPMLLVVNPNMPAKTVNELVAHVKAHPGKFKYGSTGAGGLLELAGVLFAKEMGLKAAPVPHESIGPAVTSLIGNQVQYMFLPIHWALPQVKSGKLRALAVTHAKRFPLLPDVPTIREATGKTNLDLGAWQVLLVPKGTPADVVNKVDTALKNALKDAGMRERLTAQGAVVFGGTQKESADFMKIEDERWAPVIRDSVAAKHQ